jgi:hypothetical protein
MTKKGRRSIQGEERKAREKLTSSSISLNDQPLLFTYPGLPQVKNHFRPFTKLGKRDSKTDTFGASLTEDIGSVTPLFWS